MLRRVPTWRWARGSAAWGWQGLLWVLAGRRLGGGGSRQGSPHRSAASLQQSYLPRHGDAGRRYRPHPPPSNRRRFADGQGVDLTMEFMYAAPYSNLFTNISLGAATEPFGWVLRGQVRRLACHITHIGLR